MTTDLHARTITLTGFGGDAIETYVAEPQSPQRVGSVVVIHHMPGYDEATKEIARKFAAAGYAAAVPNLYSREAPGASSDDAAAAARALGGVPDERLIGDVEAAMNYLRERPESNGKVAVIGYCSGGRQSVLAACSLPFDAAVDCYGAFVVVDPPGGAPTKATSLLEKLRELRCPLLGLFGADDQYPSPEQTEVLRQRLIELGKKFEFHTYDDAAHSFFSVDRPSYRPDVAVKAWEEIWTFFATHLHS